MLRRLYPRSWRLNAVAIDAAADNVPYRHNARVNPICYNQVMATKKAMAPNGGHGFLRTRRKGGQAAVAARSAARMSTSTPGVVRKTIMLRLSAV